MGPNEVTHDQTELGGLVVAKKQKTPRGRNGKKAIRPPRRGTTKSASASSNRKIALLRRELIETQEQQTATAAMLKVISDSAFDLPPVLNTLVESAARLCNADIAYVGRPKGDGLFSAEASYGMPPAFKDLLGRTHWKAGRESALGRVLLDRAPSHILDARSDPEYRMSDLQKIGGYRSILGVPLMREGMPIGVLVLARNSVRAFSDRQTELVVNFAAQAVIAIENAQLVSELRESLQQQTATAEVLRTISGSPGELTPVFDAILQNATRLCDAKFGMLCLGEGELFRFVGIPQRPGGLDRRERTTASPRPSNPVGPCRQD